MTNKYRYIGVVCKEFVRRYYVIMLYSAYLEKEEERNFQKQ